MGYVKIVFVIQCDSAGKRRHRKGGEELAVAGKLLHPRVVEVRHKDFVGATHGDSVSVSGVHAGEKVAAIGAQLLKEGDSLSVIP